jgi:hypothetical protein
MSTAKQAQVFLMILDSIYRLFNLQLSLMIEWKQPGMIISGINVYHPLIFPDSILCCEGAEYPSIVSLNDCEHGSIDLAVIFPWFLGEVVLGTLINSVQLSKFEVKALIKKLFIVAYIDDAVQWFKNELTTFH